jgi:hypothetical protein
MNTRDEINFKILPVTTESFYNILGREGSGSMRAKAFALYTFYCVQAVRQGSSQPLATDEFCASFLNFDLKAVRAARKFLMLSGLIEHIVKEKRGYRYVRVHFLPHELPNRNPFDLSCEESPEGDWDDEMYRQWLDRMLSNIPVLIKRIDSFFQKKKFDYKMKLTNDELTLEFENLYKRALDYGKTFPSERAFVYYLLESFFNQEKVRFLKSIAKQEVRTVTQIPIPNNKNNQNEERPWTYY